MPDDALALRATLGELANEPRLVFATGLERVISETLWTQASVRGELTLEDLLALCGGEIVNGTSLTRPLPEPNAQR
ncbi:MAG: hypothetical protein AB7S68_04470 [Polyangiaceae bacterium]